MTVLKVWYEIEEVRAVEDKIKTFCIDMCMSIEMHMGVEYEVHCHHKDIHMTYMLLRKLAKMSLREHINGKFTLTTYDVLGRSTKLSITA